MTIDFEVLKYIKNTLKYNIEYF